MLVILGNPPYNGFAGMAVEEERELFDGLSGQPEQVRKPEGQGLNDLYVRFFRMAERRIVENAQGRASSVSSPTTLGSMAMSFPGMRERYLDAFDVIRIDNLQW